MTSAPGQVVLRGIKGSPGIVVGHVRLVDRSQPQIPRRMIEPSTASREVERLREAVLQGKSQLTEVKERMDTIEGSEHIYIIESHMAILADKVVISDIVDTIRTERINAEWAVDKVFGRLRRIFDTIEDEYLRERKSDLDHVQRRVISNLMGVKRERLDEIHEEVVVVAHDLSPADMAHIDRSKIKGIALDIGGQASHTTILARALEIPLVVGLEKISQEANQGGEIILDGLAGLAILNPELSTVESYVNRKRAYQLEEEQLLAIVDRPNQTRDGRPLRLSANIEFPDEIPAMHRHGARSVGLFRSEYLLMLHRDLPDEQAHYEFYSEVLKRTAPDPVTIRTLDVGTDKLLTNIAHPREANPAMGLRAIRFCLSRQDIFRVQLRALLRASVHGELRIMFPMISGVDELRSAKALLKQVQQELDDEGVEYRKQVPLGAMIEVPSAAIMSDVLAREVDFFSVGTNDLIQYSLAVDRVNEHVNYLFDPLHPAIIRTLHLLVRSAHNAGIEIAICGEMAGEPIYLPLLLGLEMDELSMNSSSFLRVKSILLGTDYAASQQMAQSALQCHTAAEVRALVHGHLREHHPDLYKEKQL
ncbi:MAG: phosphoenolpyruvate--protein phosphotransferase [Candidatus Alcyoniella australis]|nr:phosphoenolpyruvate--protein phosphotransferase [Candidatus Alcyoniella australis]